MLHLCFSVKEPKTCTYEARNFISKISYMWSADFPWKRGSDESDSGGHPLMTSTKNDQFCNPLPHPQKRTIDQTNMLQISRLPCTHTPPPRSPLHPSVTKLFIVRYANQIEDLTTKIYFIFIGNITNGEVYIYT